MIVGGKEIQVEGRLPRIGRLVAEGFEFVEEPQSLLTELRRAGPAMDLFTFVQTLPGTTVEHPHPMEWDNVAALPVSTFEHWWNKQINGKARNMVRRSEKKGLIFREVNFDDNLVNGIREIYSEIPVRQNRPFPHYGKDIATIRQMSSTFLNLSCFIGAYLDTKLVGFAKITMDAARSQAALMNILSMIEHRDKAPTNGLIAASVRACEKRAIPYLVYSKFSYWKKKRDGLTDFKEQNGFRQFDLPRYYVPLTKVGELSLRFRAHHGMLSVVPEPVISRLRGAWQARVKWQALFKATDRGRRD